jgi:glycosyltransferase involved in cell wall biosynthesis
VGQLYATTDGVSVLKKILLITYYFPPCGGAAVQRWLRLLPLLNEAGFKITILTTSEGDYPVRDASLLEKLPTGIEVVRTYTPALGALWKKLTGKGKVLPHGNLDKSNTNSITEKIMYWLRLNLIIPDARIIWNIYAKPQALFLARVNNFDWIITTGPPHSTHLIGLFLKKRIKTKWIADFRDPWTQIYYLKRNKHNSLIQKLNSQLERKIVQSADLNLIISKAIAQQLPKGNKRILYNGFDQLQFSNIKYTKDQTFRIKFIGQLTEGQDIEALLQAISEITQTDGLSLLEFIFVGTHKQTLPDMFFPVRFLDYMPHQQALCEMVNSELLILLINDYAGNQGMLTTKLFEYIASGTPVLCIGPPDGEAAEIINQAKAGFVSDGITPYIKTYIGHIYHKWQASETVRIDHDISQWSAQQQVKELIAVLP